mgnify:CR=1 FL=1
MYLDRNLPYREEVLVVLNTPGTDFLKTMRLKAYRDGEPYKYILNRYLKDFRAGTVCVYFQQPSTAPMPVVISDHRVDTIYIREDHYYTDTAALNASLQAALLASAVGSRKTYDQYVEEYVPTTTKSGKYVPDRKTVFALRTNLLVPLMNIGFEVPLGNRFSIGGDFYSPWIPRNIGDDINHREWCAQLQFGTIEGRYWFGRKHSNNKEKNYKHRLTGHSVGIFAGAGYFDIGWDWHGNQGEFYGAGLDYLYALPVGRRGDVHFEFELAVGFATAPGTRTYDVYVKDGNLFETKEVKKDISYFGPARAMISLVVPIHKNLETAKQKEDKKAAEKATVGTKGAPTAATAAAAADAATKAVQKAKAKPGTKTYYTYPVAAPVATKSVAPVDKLPYSYTKPSKADNASTKKVARAQAKAHEKSVKAQLSAEKAQAKAEAKANAEIRAARANAAKVQAKEEARVNSEWLNAQKKAEAAAENSAKIQRIAEQKAAAAQAVADQKAAAAQSAADYRAKQAQAALEAAREFRADNVAPVTDAIDNIKEADLVKVADSAKEADTVKPTDSVR